MSLISFPALVISVAMSSVLPPSPDQVLAVPLALTSQTRHIIGAQAQSPERRLELLIDFVSEPEQLGFRYAANATHTVAETFARREGNCLSFTLLFLGLARELGLATHAREVRVPPAWQDDGSTLFDVGHVNVGVDTPGRHRTVDFDPDLLRSQRLAAPWRGRPISDQRALAHYYNNRAAELLAAGHGRLARPWLQLALELDPEFDPAWNTLGVVERRFGDLDQARRYFEQARTLEPESISVLFNLIALAEEMGQLDRAQRYRDQLHALHPDDPWFQWQLGRGLERLGQSDQALVVYRRAFDINPRQPRFSNSLIRVLEALNRRVDADRVRARAQAFSLAVNQRHKPKTSIDSVESSGPSVGPQDSNH